MQKREDLGALKREKKMSREGKNKEKLCVDAESSPVTN
jgi:hypothetical protein